MQGSVQDMQARSQLLPLLRSPLLGDLLAWVFLHPDEDNTVSDLARRLATSQSTVSREADRLVRSGLLIETRRGNLRLLRANWESPLARPLTELLTITYGPAAILGDLLEGIDGITEAYIYGSWAARYLGEAGYPPQDIDVLVVGDADDDDLFDAARAAEQRLGREVNVRRVSERSWHATASTDPFLTSVRSRPLVPIGITGDDE
jgi:DNA-binding transcriptional ArsR family regulator